MQYQMDTLLLDIAPITIVGCWLETTARQNQQQHMQGQRQPTQQQPANITTSERELVT